MDEKKKDRTTKRQRFVIISIILTFILLSTQLVTTNFRYLMVAIFAILTYFFSWLALWEDIRGIEWLTLFILPTTFSTGVALFYFLLPVRWLTRLPVALLYGISIYAIFLSENIFNAAAVRTIQLHQAALAVSSFLTIVTFFLFSNIIFSFHFSSFHNLVLIFIISLLTFCLNLWNISLEEFLEKRLVEITLCLSLILAELAFILSFWPDIPVIGSLFLTTVFYLLLGISQTYLLDKPTGNLVLEYTFFLFTLVVLLLRSRWGG